MNLEIKHHTKVAKHLIIFIHGIGGSSESFQNDKNEYFHEFFNSDILESCDIGYYSYSSTLVSSRVKSFISNYITCFDEEFNKEIYEISDILKTDFLNLISRYETINFICHSMGGLIVKDLLLNKQLSFDKRTFYITLATPHKGSEIANKFFVINNRHPQVKVLKTDSHILTQLNTEFKYKKDNFNSKFYYGIFDTIVPKDKAYSEGCEDLLVGVNGNHVNICKPKNEHKYTTLLVNINQTIVQFLNIQKQELSTNRNSKLNLPLLVLFDILCEDSQLYYLVKEIDKIIRNTLKIKNIWIYGESGVGKTSAAKYYLVNNRKDFQCSIYFTNTSKIVEEYLQLIYEDLIDKAGIEDFSDSYSINIKIYKVLSFLSESFDSVTIYLDELSDLGQVQFEVFFIAFVDILTNQRNDSNLNNIKFIITTIFNPTNYMNNLDSISHQEKINSKFQFIELQKWEEKELFALYEIISCNINYKLSNVESLISSFEGKPRKLKEMIKIRLSEEGI